LTSRAARRTDRRAGRRVDPRQSTASVARNSPRASALHWTRARERQYLGKARCLETKWAEVLRACSLGRSPIVRALALTSSAAVKVLLDSSVQRRSLRPASWHVRRGPRARGRSVIRQSGPLEGKRRGLDGRPPSARSSRTTGPAAVCKPILSGSGLSILSPCLSPNFSKRGNPHHLSARKKLPEGRCFPLRGVQIPRRRPSSDCRVQPVRRCELAVSSWHESALRRPRGAHLAASLLLTLVAAVAGAILSGLPTLGPDSERRSCAARVERKTGLPKSLSMPAGPSGRVRAASHGRAASWSCARTT